MNQPGTRWLCAVAGAAIALVLVACGSGGGNTDASVTTVVAPSTSVSAPKGDELADPTVANHGLDRFSAPGMDVHFLYPATFRVITPHRFQRTIGYQGNSISAELTFGGATLQVTEYQALTTEPLPGDAQDMVAGYDKTIQKLTGHKLTARIHVVHGDVLMTWPAVLQGDGSTVQFSDLFDQDYDLYELLCAAPHDDFAHVRSACTEALSTLMVASDTD